MTSTVEIHRVTDHAYTAEIEVQWDADGITCWKILEDDDGLRVELLHLILLDKDFNDRLEDAIMKQESWRRPVEG